MIKSKRLKKEFNEISDSIDILFWRQEYQKDIVLFVDF